MCVTATDRIHQTKLGLYGHKYRGGGGGWEEGESSKRKGRRKRKEGEREEEKMRGQPAAP